MKKKTIIILLLGFIIGFGFSTILVLLKTEIRIEKSPMTPNEKQAEIIKNARVALENQNYLASAYFCSSIKSDNDGQIVEFNSDCGSVSVRMPFGLEVGLSSLCLDEHLVRIHRNGNVSVIEK